MLRCHPFYTKSCHYSSLSSRCKSSPLPVISSFNLLALSMVQTAYNMVHRKIHPAIALKKTLLTALSFFPPPTTALNSTNALTASRSFIHALTVCSTTSGWKFVTGQKTWFVVLERHRRWWPSFLHHGTICRAASIKWLFFSSFSSGSCACYYSV